MYLHWSEHEVQLHVPFETISKYITLQATLAAVINTALTILLVEQLKQIMSVELCRGLEAQNAEPDDISPQNDFLD